LQFEVGIQSFNEEVQQRISRRQDNAQTQDNLRWLLTHSQAHLHTDLIFGLPGESWASFAAGFDRLYALGPHEIQLGLLKRLRGTPIARHTQAHGMVYDSAPPYSVQQTGALSAEEVQPLPA
jgi:coproporphyrinogen III oxidase-like Fe-S oxidoreductase